MFNWKFTHKYFTLGLGLFVAGLFGLIFPQVIKFIFWVLIGLGVLGMGIGFYKENFL